MSREKARFLFVIWEKARYKEAMNTNDSGLSPGKAAFYINRIKWLEHLCGRHDVSHVTYRVGSLIALKTNAKDQTCWWSVKAIAEEIGCNKWSVTTATKQLVDLNLLMVARKKGGRNNIYALVFPWED